MYHRKGSKVLPTEYFCETKNSYLENVREYSRHLPWWYLRLIKLLAFMEGVS